MSVVTLIAGCNGGVSVSPSDQTLIRDADNLHAKLQPAIVERLDPPLQRYFEQICTRVTTAARQAEQEGMIKSAGEGPNAWMFGKDLDLHLVDSELANSFTSGGRHLYVYDGLFQLCRSEDEFASVVCHEYAHVYARHVQHDLKRDPSLRGDQAVTFPFATLRWTPGQNRDADAIALAIYCRAGWDPGRFASLYQRLIEDGGGVPGVTPADGAALRERVLSAQQRTDALPPAARDWGQPPVADDARFAQLQAKAKGLAVARDRQAELLLAAFPSSLGDAESPGQARAREQLFPAPAAPARNEWGKGLPGR
jgi:predicted Zn-dependent protease